MSVSLELVVSSVSPHATWTAITPHSPSPHLWEHICPTSARINSPHPVMLRIIRMHVYALTRHPERETVLLCNCWLKGYKCIFRFWCLEWFISVEGFTIPTLTSSAIIPYWSTFSCIREQKRTTVTVVRNRMIPSVHAVYKLCFDFALYLRPSDPLHSIEATAIRAQMADTQICAGDLRQTTFKGRPRPLECRSTARLSGLYRLNLFSTSMSRKRSCQACVNQTHKNEIDATRGGREGGLLVPKPVEWGCQVGVSAFWRGSERASRCFPVGSRILLTPASLSCWTSRERWPPPTSDRSSASVSLQPGGRQTRGRGRQNDTAV